MTNLRLLDIDDLRRNAEDGAYHCPSCDAPFTRRSNLRRHYGIHIRNKNTRCHACRKVFGSSDELQYHALRCPRSAWSAPGTRPNTPPDSHPNNVNIINKQDASDHVSAGSPGLFSAASSPPQQDDLDEFFSSLTSSIPTSPSLSPFSSLESPSSSGNGSTPDWPVAKLPTAGLLQKDPGEDPFQNNQLHKSIASFQNVGHGRRLKSKEKPIYTRRQVEDMLDIVSKAFVTRMEETIRGIGCTNGDFWPHSSVEPIAVPEPPTLTYPFTL